MDAPAALRSLPSVDRFLRSDAARPLLAAHGRARVTEALRALLAEVRAGAPRPDDLAAALAGRLAAPSALRPVFNLTGTVLHTNLGRALLAEAAIEAADRRHARRRPRSSSTSTPAAAASATPTCAASCAS